MLKKILAIVAMLYAAAAFAAVDVNKATAAELDAIKGIGPAISGKILDERKKGNFKDWNDFIQPPKLKWPSRPLLQPPQHPPPLLLQPKPIQKLKPR